MAESFRDVLGQLFKARFPLLYIESFEEQRVIAEVTAVASDSAQVRTPRRIVTWSRTEGLRPAEGADKSATTEAARALDVIVRRDEPTVYIFRDLHADLGDGHRPPNSDVVRKLRDVAAAFRVGSVARVLILVSPVLRIPRELEKDLTLVDFPFLANVTSGRCWTV